MNIKQIIKILTALFILFLIYVLFELSIYKINQRENEKQAELCYNLNEDINYSAEQTNNFFKNKILKKSQNCYCSMYSLISPRFLVYKTKIDNKYIKFLRPAFSYIVPDIVIEKADVILSYGVWESVDFEYSLANEYPKPIYAFDCGIKKIYERSPYISFKSECIGTDNFILKDKGQTSSGKIHSFGQKIKELNLEDKKIYLKMDIAGAEIEVLPDILKYADNLAGMSVVFRIDNTRILKTLNEILKLVEKDFVLVSRDLIHTECLSGHKCNYIGENIPRVISLTYINKNIIDKKYIPFNQSYYINNIDKNKQKIYSTILPYEISWVVVLNEKINNMFSKQ